MREKLCTVKWTKRRNFDRARRDLIVIQDIVCRLRIHHSRRIRVLVRLREDTSNSNKLLRKLILIHIMEMLNSIRHTNSRYLLRAPNFSNMWSTMVVRVASKTAETLFTSQVLAPDSTQKIIKDQDKTPKTVLATIRVPKSQ